MGFNSGFKGLRMRVELRPAESGMSSVAGWRMKAGYFSVLSKN